MEFWTGFSSVKYADSRDTIFTSIPDSFYHNFAKDNDIAASIADALELSLPVTLACPEHGFKHKGKKTVYHLVCCPFPEYSFLRTRVRNANIYIACPELCFLQASRELPFLDLVLFGYQLCAQYVADASAEYGQLSRTPVTSVESIKKYIKKATGFRGKKAAFEALKYVLDDSNSPRESALALICSLPVEKGGYGFNMPKPEMNCDIELSDDGKSLMNDKIKRIRSDIGWRKQRVVLEYNSDSVHLKKSEFVRDADRQNAYQSAGYKCYVITNGHFSSLEHLDKVMKIVGKDLGYAGIDERLEAYRVARQKVFGKVFDRDFR